VADPNGVAPTDPLALDGKSLRGIHVNEVPGVHLVAAYAHEARAVVAQIRTEGKGQELAAAKEVLDQVSLEGRLVTGDALLTQREVNEKLVQRGGEGALRVSYGIDLHGSNSGLCVPGALQWRPLAVRIR